MIAAPTFTTRNTNQYADPPERGRFALFTVTAMAQPGQKFNINPFDFYVRLADGTHIGYGTGSLYMGENGLNGTTLTPGEKIKGIVAFDVPAGRGTLVYAPLSEALGEWAY